VDGGRAAAGPRRAAALLIVCAALFLTMLDSTVVSVALPDMQPDLHIGVAGLQWVVSAYVLVFAALLLTGGTLGDLFGRQRLLVIGLVVFVAGSVVSAVAGSTVVLYAGRVVQGAGAAASEPGTLSILRQIYPERRARDRAIGVWAGVSGLALALGPLVGGLLIRAGGWRDIFWFNVAAGGLIALAAARWVPDSADRAGRRIDAMGQLTGAAALGLLTYAVIHGEEIGYTATNILGSFAAVAALGAAFVLLERRSRSPVLPLALFRDGTFTGVNIVAFTASLAIFAIFFVLSLYFQVVDGLTALSAAVRFLPMTGAMIVAGPLTGRWVARRGARIPLLTGLALATAGMFATSRLLGGGGTAVAVGAALPTLGFGLGMILSPVTSGVMSSTPRVRSGMAAATTNVSRQVGAVLGVAVLGAIAEAELRGTLTGRIARLHLSALIRPFINSAVDGIISGQTNIRTLASARTLDGGRIYRAGVAAFGQGVHVALGVAAAALLVATLLAAVLVERRRGAPSGAAGPAVSPRGASGGDLLGPAPARPRPGEAGQPGRQSGQPDHQEAHEEPEVADHDG
jgi:EmrB/QacA subfamily drug resistance transporter